MNPPRELEMQDGSTQMGYFCQLGEVTSAEFTIWVPDFSDELHLRRP